MNITQTVEATIETQNTIEATIDDSMNVVEATLNPTTEITAEVNAGFAGLAVQSIGTGTSLFESYLLGVLKLYSLKSSDSSVTIAIDGNEIDLKAVATQVQIFELKNLLKIEQATYYSELAYDGDNNPIKIDKWTDSGKSTKLFTKTITWVAGNATKTVTTDVVTGAVLTVDLTYDGNGNVTEIVETLA